MLLLVALLQDVFPLTIAARYLVVIRVDVVLAHVALRCITRATGCDPPSCAESGPPRAPARRGTDSLGEQRQAVGMGWGLPYLVMKLTIAGPDVLSSRLRVRTMREWLSPGTMTSELEAPALCSAVCISCD